MLALQAKFVRAQVLASLGRYGEALAEIDALATIVAETLGPRHPETLDARRLRASVIEFLGRYGEALAEIDALVPIVAEAVGPRHPETLTTRYLRASQHQSGET